VLLRSFHRHASAPPAAFAVRLRLSGLLLMCRFIHSAKRQSVRRTLLSGKSDSRGSCACSAFRRPACLCLPLSQRETDESESHIQAGRPAVVSRRRYSLAAVSVSFGGFVFCACASAGAVLGCMWFSVVLSAHYSVVASLFVSLAPLVPLVAALVLSAF